MKRAEGVTREEHDPNSLKPSLRVMAGEAKPASPAAPGLAGQLRSASVLHEREAAASRTTALSGPEDPAPEHEIAVAAGPLAWIFEACADADANHVSESPIPVGGGSSAASREGERALPSESPLGV